MLPRKCQFIYESVYPASYRIWPLSTDKQVRTQYLHTVKACFNEGNIFKGLFLIIFPLKIIVDFPPINSIVGRIIRMQNTKPAQTSSPSRHPETEILNLQPGDLVTVRSEQEILATLDAKGTLKGLSFMPEMRQYCGKQFKVLKRLEKIILETTGEMRIIKNTVLLDNVLCDGSAHQGCDRSCFCFWREAWLKPIDKQSNH